MEGKMTDLGLVQYGRSGGGRLHDLKVDGEHVISAGDAAEDV